MHHAHDFMMDRVSECVYECVLIANAQTSMPLMPEQSPVELAMSQLVQTHHHNHQKAAKRHKKALKRVGAFLKSSV